MRYLMTLLATPLLILLTITSCKKQGNDNVFTCSDQYNMCVEIDGQERVGDATLREISFAHHKLTWKAASGEEIVMDIYGSTKGTYLIERNAQENAGTDLFFIKDGVTYFGTTGMLDVLELNGNIIEANFEASASAVDGPSVILSNGVMNTQTTASD